MIERVIENWLTSVNELGFTLPFCEVLVSEGFTIVRVARGGPGEFGKDVVARSATGHLWTFQLKGGDINLKKWGEIRPQIEDLVHLPVFAAGVSKGEAHQPCLVTNGEIVGDAATSITEYAQRWARSGAPTLQVVDRGVLLHRFLNAHQKFLPTEKLDFRRFVELYIADHTDLLPRQALASFLEDTVTSERIGTRPAARKRAVESMMLLGSYLIEGYRAASNHVAVAMGWTTVAMVMMHVVERDSLPNSSYRESLRLAWAGLDEALHELEEEVLSRPDFVEPRLSIVEPLVYGVRVLSVLGWLATAQLLRNQRLSADGARILKVFHRELHAQRFTTEADWSSVLASSLFIASQTGQAEGERLIQAWLDFVLNEAKTSEGPGVPSPYWLQEKVLALAAGLVPPHEQERFSKHTYTAMSAADMLVRRMRRQSVAARWPTMSRLTLCDFCPSKHADWFLWSSKSGEVAFENPTESRSWAEWRSQAAHWNQAALPAALLANSEWLLPMILTYPHRANRAACAAADGLVGDMATAQ